jgi:hypothetical protein
MEASVESYRGSPFNHALSNSLKTIRAARSRFNLLAAHAPTKAVLTTQVELCEIMLAEIRSIRCCLGKRMSTTSRFSVSARRVRSSKLPVIPQRDPSDRSKQRKSVPLPYDQKGEGAQQHNEDVTNGRN